MQDSTSISTFTLFIAATQYYLRFKVEIHVLSSPLLCPHIKMIKPHCSPHSSSYRRKYPGKKSQEQIDWRSWLSFSPVCPACCDLREPDNRDLVTTPDFQIIISKLFTNLFAPISYFYSIGLIRTIQGCGQRSRALFNCQTTALSWLLYGDWYYWENNSNIIKNIFLFLFQPAASQSTKQKRKITVEVVSSVGKLLISNIKNLDRRSLMIFLWQSTDWFSQIVSTNFQKLTRPLTKKHAFVIEV